jgi:hypothetical protein
MNEKQFIYLQTSLAEVFDEVHPDDPSCFLFRDYVIRLNRGEQDEMTWVDIIIDILDLSNDEHAADKMATVLSVNYDLSPTQPMPRWFCMDKQTQHVLVMQRMYGNFLTSQDLYAYFSDLIDTLNAVDSMIEGAEMNSDL